MGPIRMLKLFSAAVIGWFAVADVHAAWFCPMCQVKHEEAICPNANTTDKFGIWQPTWWCDACASIHRSKQWWWDENQLLVTCKNGCWPCRTCHAVHSDEDAFNQDAWCCPTCRTQHTDGRLYCEQQHGNNTKKVWFCSGCSKPHGTYKPCTSAWFCDECKKGHLIGETCPNGRWYCSACQKAYAANDKCEHSWNCPQEGGCGKTHRLDEICPKGNMYCLPCRKVLLKDGSCDHYWACPSCETHHAMNDVCPNGRRYCTNCEKILEREENCPHYWYCDTCGEHHAVDAVCTATNPHRWYCPNEACRTAYDVGKACEHFWYCEGCQTRHVLTETCMNGWIYCANEGCKKVLNATESCEHYWACPVCKKTHHAAAESNPCPQYYWFCIDCFRNNPSTGIYAQTDGCPHYWWCKDCNSGNGIRYDADTACEHRWGCSEEQTGHTFTEPCSAGNWYCTDCDGGTRYASGTQLLCAHTWYCPDCQYGHKLADGCTTRWYCSECEDKNKIHAVADETYCDHLWYCITCQKGHLFTEVCPQGYWFCKDENCRCAYNSAEQTSCDHSWYCCYVDEEYLGCKVGHLKTETCPNHYRWCGETGCDGRVYDPNTPCVHCWECPTCQITYGPNAMCPTDKTWCCGCPAVYSFETKPFCTDCRRWVCSDCDVTNAVKSSNVICGHKWFCVTHQQLNEANTKCADTTCLYFGCTQCGMRQMSCCKHYWVCNQCNPCTFHSEHDAVCPKCNTGWFCPDCVRVFTGSWYCYYPAETIHYWRCDRDRVRVPVSQTCLKCNYWFCTICKDTTYRSDRDTQGHRRPDLVNNVPLLHAKKAFSKQSPFINNISLLNVFEENNKPFEEVHSSNDVPEEKNLIDTAEERHSDGGQPNQPMLRTMEKLKRKKNKLFRSREEDLKKQSKRSSSSSSSSKDKDVKPHKKFIINMRKKDSDDEDPKEFDPKYPSRKTIRFGKHPKFKYNGCNHTHAKNLNIDVHTAALKKSNRNDLKREGNKPINSPKIELKSSKQSNEKKYPQLTQSHIQYSEKREDLKQSSPKSSKKSESSSDSDTSKPKFTEKEEKKISQASKVERPKLQYNINLDALMNKIKEEPLSISGVSNFGKAAEMKEQSRIGELQLKLNRISNLQTSSKPKKDGASIVPSTSKVIKGGENKKEDDPFASSEHKTSKKQSTFKPSSSSSDSDESKTPEGNTKGSKVYTNDTPGDPQKSFKKTYKEDEGYETPSNSLSSLRFGLLKSPKTPKNKHAAPNASSVKPNLTKLPPASDESQQFEFKTIEGPKEPSKSLKSDEETPNGEPPKEETPKSENASDEEKKASFSKKSSKKSVKTYSHNSHSEKQSDGEGLKSDKENHKEDASSEDAVSSHSKRSSKKSVKSDDIFDKSLAESIVNQKDSDKEDKKSSDAEDEHSGEEDEDLEEESEASETSEK